MSLRLVFSRRRRDISTASKVLIFVSMDEFEWVDDTDGRITLQQIDGVETGFALDVDEVFALVAKLRTWPRRICAGKLSFVVRGGTAWSQCGGA